MGNDMSRTSATKEFDNNSFFLHHQRQRLESLNFGPKDVGRGYEENACPSNYLRKIVILTVSKEDLLVRVEEVISERGKK